MEETKNIESGSVQEQEEKSSIDFQLIYSTLILNWKWFLLSLIVCLGLGYIYLKYATPQYQATTKILIKEDTQNKRGGMNSSMIQNAANLGFISNSNGIDNEIEILSAQDLAEQAVKEMKAYVSYYHKASLKDQLVYKEQEINVDLDQSHLMKLNAPIKLIIQKDGASYKVKGTYNIPIDAFTYEKEPVEFEKTLKNLPAYIPTRVGTIILSANGSRKLEDGKGIKAVIVSPEMAAKKYVKNLTVSQTSKTTTIAELVLNDQDPQRSIDYLKSLIKVYNRQANEDKNEIAFRTEQFINNRLQKINSELGTTEGELESYKKRNRMVEMKINATASVTNADMFEQKLNEANTQVDLLNELGKYMNEPGNKYQTILQCGTHRRKLHPAHQRIQQDSPGAQQALAQCQRELTHGDSSHSTARRPDRLHQARHAPGQVGTGDPAQQHRPPGCHLLQPDRQLARAGARADTDRSPAGSEVRTLPDAARKA